MESFLDGHLGWCHLLTIVTSSGTKIVLLFLQDPDFNTYSEVEFLDHSVLLALISEELSQFSIAAAPFYILTNSVQHSSFSTSSPTFVVFWFCIFF
jgi:hypothetical protein